VFVGDKLTDGVNVGNGVLVVPYWGVSQKLHDGPVPVGVDCGVLVGVGVGHPIIKILSN
jgi:hypothetical protein